MVAKPFFFDTSILIAGTLDTGADSRHAQEVLGLLSEGKLGRSMTAWHCCLEFHAVLTRLPEEYRLEPEEAVQLLEKDIMSWLEIVDLPSRFRRTFLNGVAGDRIAGGRLYDAHIAEIAWRAGAKMIVTENLRHFESLSDRGIKAIGASAFLGLHKAE